MGQEKDPEGKTSVLRRRAEDALDRRPGTEEASSLIPEEVERLVHELRVHQIELEMQNENLRQAHIEMEELKNRYLDLYDFAPVGYVTLNRNGRIREANLAAVQLLGVERQALMSMTFSRFVSPEFGDAFYLHLGQVFETQSKQTCEIEIAREDGAHFYAQLESIALNDENGQFNLCRTVVSDITERKRKDEGLKEAGAFLSTLMDAIPAPLFYKDTDGRYIGFNKSFEKFYGRTRQELVGKSVFDIAPRELAEVYHAKDVELLHRQGVQVYDSQVRDAQGALHDVVFHKATFTDHLGHVLGLIGVILDITDRKKAEKELRQSQEMLSLALEGANLGIWDWDLTTGKALWSERNQRMLGYEPNEFEPNIKNWKKLVHPDDWPLVSDHLNLHMEGKLPLFQAEYRIMNKCGAWQWVEAQGKVIEFDSDGKPIRMAGVVAEISERKKVEEALRENREALENILDNIPVMVAFLDRGGDHKYVNRCWRDTLGWSLEEAQSRDVLSDLYPDPDNKQYVVDYISNAAGSWGDFQTLTRDGRLITTSWLNVPMGDGANIGIGLDVTERKQAEEKQRQLTNRLFQAQKAQAVATLTGGIAHDFNNLLTIMNGYTEMILQDSKQDDPIYADLEKILETGRKGAELVQRLLTLSKKGESSPEPLDLNCVVQNVTALVEETFPKMIEVVTNLGEDLGKVNADSAQLDQVFLNICINAKEAMPEGGRIKVDTGRINVDEDYCSLHAEARPGPYVLVEISDTGSGMGKETMERMFDPFFTTKGWDFNRGTGLGLSVSKGIVEQHSGWITCESEPGKGTTFRLYFPVIEDTPAVQAPDLVSKIVTSGEKILLVDDEEYVLDLGKRILEQAGYSVIPAANGKEALEIYEREQKDIGLAVLDLIMPQMSGEKCLEELLKMNPTLRVVACTGHSLSGRERDRLGARVKGFVNKPYQLKQLLDVVRDVLVADS